MDAIHRFISCATLVLASLLVGCASQPPAVVPTARDHHFQQLELERQRALARHYPGLSRRAAPARFDRSIRDDRRVQVPQYRKQDLDEMMAEVNAELKARCQNVGQSTDMAAQAAGTAATGAVVGAIANGATGAGAGVIIGGLLGANRATDFARHICQELINERDFIRRQHSALEEWQRGGRERDERRARPARRY